ncbi:unnamed protein product [Calicophoron daubneyi]|uniref:Replication stress response regulator SDE2 n=1 Tax=Calicophoron daubneyi TaxID=300641 RepID=A0AAV2TEN9_CALDB
MQNPSMLAESVMVDSDFFYTCEGRPVYDLASLPEDAIVEKHFKLRGGKGGFGSMLRAIGSQIEKTTNHEMCRDLSGRRMRDVNTEQKLREWYAKASDREREKLQKYHEKKQKRQEMLAKGPLPGHKFSDKEYERQKRKITYELHGAIDAAIATILKEKSSTSKSNPSASSTAEPQTKRKRLWIEGFDENISSSSSVDSSDSSSDGNISSGDDRPDEATQQIAPSSSVGGSESKEEAKSSGFVSFSSDGNRIVNSPVLSEGKTDLAKSSPEKTAEQQSQPNTEPPASSSSSTSAPAAKPLSEEQLMEATSSKDLEHYGLDVLKSSLTTRGLKCGGTLSERATRLFSVRGLKPEDYPHKIRVRNT